MEKPDSRQNVIVRKRLFHNKEGISSGIFFPLPPAHLFKYLIAQILQSQ